MFLPGVSINFHFFPPVSSHLKSSKFGDLRVPSWSIKKVSDLRSIWLQVCPFSEVYFPETNSYDCEPDNTGLFTTYLEYLPTTTMWQNGGCFPWFYTQSGSMKQRMTAGMCWQNLAMVTKECPQSVPRDVNFGVETPLSPRVHLLHHP